MAKLLPAVRLSICVFCVLGTFYVLQILENVVLFTELNMKMDMFRRHDNQEKVFYVSIFSRY